MGTLRKLKKVVAMPYRAFENTFIPFVNSTNDYLDKWFPQEKWNWRKVAIIWAGVQAVIISILELYIAYKYRQQLLNTFNYVQEKDEDEINVFAQADPLSVYHMIFLVGLFYQFYLICDTVTKSSTLQLIAVAIFSLALAVYSIVQYTQAKGSYNFIDLNNLKKMSDDDKLSGMEKLRAKNTRPEGIEIFVIVLSFLFSFGWVIIALRLYKIFGWNVFKQLGADHGVKNRLKLYQIFLTLLKIDFFFFISFAMQFLIFIVVHISEDETKLKVIKYVNILLLIIVLIMPFIGFAATTKENYKLMTLFLVLLCISIGYMTYSFADIINDKIHKETEMRYRNCQNSLLLSCVFGMLISYLTFSLALINFKNFPKGLKKDKTLRMLKIRINYLL